MLISHLVYVCVLSHFSHVRLFVTPWTIARQAPLPTEFSRQEYWGGYHCLLQGSPLIQGWNSVSCLLPWQVGSLPLGQPGKPRWMITGKETELWEQKSWGSSVTVSQCLGVEETRGVGSGSKYKAPSSSVEHQSCSEPRLLTRAPMV